MKTILSILFFVGAGHHSISAQAQAPKAETVDQFGRTNCCDFEARIDNFIFRLENQPNATGYAVVSGDHIFQRIYLERFLLDTVANSYKNRKTFAIVRAAGQGLGPTVEFWLVPDGAEKPEFHETTLDFTLSPDQKPFLFEDNEDPGICPVYSLDLGHLSEFLNSNPAAGGNIVISSRVSAKEYRDLRTKLLGNARAVNIAVDRLRFFRGKTRSNSIVEIWLVPHRGGGKRN